MGIKSLWAKVGKLPKRRDSHSVLLMPESKEAPAPIGEISGQEFTSRAANTEMVVKKADPLEKKDNAEVLNEAFNRLVGQLQGINDHLGKQVGQNEELMSQMEKLPELLESLPNAVKNQKQVVDSLTEQLKNKALKDQQFADVVAKIPAETSKQTNAMIDMNTKLSAAVDIDTQIAQGFGKFNDTLNKLDGDTVSQTDSIMQMSRAFAASDQHLKDLICAHNRRFLWIFVAVAAVSIIAVAALAVGTVMLLKYLGT